MQHNSNNYYQFINSLNRSMFILSEQEQVLMSVRVHSQLANKVTNSNMIGFGLHNFYIKKTWKAYLKKKFLTTLLLNVDSWNSWICQKRKYEKNTEWPPKNVAWRRPALHKRKTIIKINNVRRKTNSWLETLCMFQ